MRYPSKGPEKLTNSSIVALAGKTFFQGSEKEPMPPAPAPSPPAPVRDLLPVRL